ncbi:MAG: hypothetical protein QGG73_11185 [Candidatus Hydrogenedentes bacterium]|nr:hypothetical protein [Candidatus Hydrogenedentota bacterium]
MSMHRCVLLNFAMAIAHYSKKSEHHQQAVALPMGKRGVSKLSAVSGGVASKRLWPRKVIHYLDALGA